MSIDDATKVITDIIPGRQVRKIFCTIAHSASLSATAGLSLIAFGLATAERKISPLLKMSVSQQRL